MLQGGLQHIGGVTASRARCRIAEVNGNCCLHPFGDHKLTALGPQPGVDSHVICIGICQGDLPNLLGLGNHFIPQHQCGLRIACGLLVSKLGKTNEHLLVGDLPIGDGRESCLQGCSLLQLKSNAWATLDQLQQCRQCRTGEKTQEAERHNACQSQHCTSSCGTSTNQISIGSNHSDQWALAIGVPGAANEVATAFGADTTDRLHHHGQCDHEEELRDGAGEAQHRKPSRRAHCNALTQTRSRASLCARLCPKLPKQAKLKSSQETPSPTSQPRSPVSNTGGVEGAVTVAIVEVPKTM